MDPSKQTKIAYSAFFLSFILIAVLHFFIKPTFETDSGEKNSEIILRYVDNITETQKILIDKFNEEYMGRIKVELINFPLYKFSSHERKQLLTKYLRNGSAKIDLFSVDQVWIPRFSNWAEPLDNLISENEKEQFHNIVNNTCVVNNSLRAIPLFIDIGVMYCRKDILEKIPNYENILIKLQQSITWEEFIKLGQSEFFDKNPFYTFSADNYEGLMCSFAELYPQNTDLFSNPNSLQHPNIVKATKFIVDLVNKYKISPSAITQLQEDNFLEYYENNHGVFLRGWPNSFSSFFYVNRNTDKEPKYICVPLPHFKGEEKRFVSGGWNMMISKFSKNKKAAVEFLKYWLREDVQTYMYANQGFLPSLKLFYEQEKYLNKYQRLNFFKDLFPYAVYRPVDKNYTMLSDILTRFLKASIKNEITVEEALIKAGTEIYSVGISVK